MRKFVPILLLGLVLPLLAFGMHKYYVSVTTVKHAPEEKTLQVTSRMFIDDFEHVLKERYGVTTRLATEHEKEDAGYYIEKYLRSKLVFHVNGEAVPYTYLGREYESDMLVIYVEVPGMDLSRMEELSITNEVLTDLFQEQQNIVHFHIKGDKHSFILFRENNKGMLKL